MSYTDPIADMLTRIRNAVMAKKVTADIPDSKLKRAVLEILKREKYIEGYTVEKDKEHAGKLTVQLHYEERMPLFTNIKRLSRPGLRLYAKAHQIPRPLGGAGLVILSTTKGVMSGKDARLKGLGGELICEIY